MRSGWRPILASLLDELSGASLSSEDLAILEGHAQKLSELVEARADAATVDACVQGVRNRWTTALEVNGLAELVTWRPAAGQSWAAERVALIEGAVRRLDALLGELEDLGRRQAWTRIGELAGQVTATGQDLLQLLSAGASTPPPSPDAAGAAKQPDPQGRPPQVRRKAGGRVAGQSMSLFVVRIPCGIPRERSRSPHPAQTRSGSLSAA
jgi:hypothetical protein